MANIRGAFPLPSAQVAEGGARIALASGQYFYPGPGQGLLITGGNTNLEYFDPLDQVWRTLDVGLNSGQWGSIDGYNYRLHNITGTISGLAITGAGSGGTNGIGTVATGASVTVAAAPAGGRTAVIVPVVGGSVQAPTVAQGGSGFTVAPLVVIDPPPGGGIQATAVATVSGGAVTAITMVTVGAGYLASPNFWLIPQTPQYQGGSAVGVAAGVIPVPGLVFPGNAVPGNQNTSATGAQLVSNALTGSGTLTGLKIIDGGAGYTASAPTLTIGGTLIAATATASVGNTTPAADTSFFQPRVQ